MSLLLHNACVPGIQKQFSSVNQSQSHTIRYEVVIKMVVRLQSSKDPPGAEWVYERELTHMNVQFGLAISSFSRGLLGSPHGVATGCSLQRLIQEKSLWKRHSIFHDLVLKVTNCDTDQPYSVCKKITLWCMNIRKWLIRASWRFSVMPCFSLHILTRVVFSTP